MSESIQAAPASEFTLDHSVAIRVPSQCSCHEPLNAGLRDAALFQVSLMFAESFGGAEITERRGFYIHHNGELANEAVSVVSAFAENVDREQAEGWAVALADQLHQESVALEIDGVMTFHSARKWTAPCDHV